ncbi:histone deacetylase domain-containing protein [Cytidiella melzeri]|nr:histone deacetylase domain-containing protein [Cytidiella melzeri]
MTKPSGTIRIVHPRSHLSSQESGSSTRTDDNSLPKKSVPALTGRPTVFLQEACLLHKWIRTRDRSNVYERPERLRAVNAGLAAAYAQLEYAATARVDTDSLERKKAWRPFDVVRSSATLDISTHPAAAYIHGQLVDGAASSYGTHLKSWCQRSKEEIARSGSEISDMYEQDLYLCPESITAFQGALGTVCEAVDAVMAARPAGFDLMNLKAQSLNSRAFVVVRPPGHHCSEDNPMGFGFVNNVAVGAIHASRQHKIRRVIIFDYDLHHGNGTQAIVRSINERIAERGPRAVSPDPHIFYGSIHDVLSYPCEDGDPEMIRDASTTLYGDDGNWIESIHLQPYATEEQFWKHYQQTYSRLFNTASRFLRATGGTNNLDDDVLIFISSGFDASEYETEDMSRHGRKVPTAFYHRFTRDACKFSEQYANGRIISVLEGGYSDKALISGALAHVTALADVDGLTDQDWWGLKRLDELEKASKKRRGRPPRPDSLDGWLRRTMEIFEALETPLNDPGTTMDLPRLSEEVRRSMGEAARKDSLKRSARPPAGAGPQTRAKRAKGVVDRKREHLEGPSGEDEREDDPFLS